MNSVTDRQVIFKDVDTLSYIDKLCLLSHITNNLLKSNMPSKRNLGELKGLGKYLWQKHDIDNYIQNERESWD